MGGATLGLSTRFSDGEDTLTSSTSALMPPQTCSQQPSLEDLQSLTGLVNHLAEAHPEDDEVLELRDKMMGVLLGECEAQGQSMPDMFEELEGIERN